METLLITGIDTIVGANLATCMSKKYRVIGVSQDSTEFMEIAGCKTILTIQQDLESIRSTLKQFKISRIIHCSVASIPTWQQTESTILDSDMIEAARNWAEVSSQLDIPLTVISSDGLFTGPWMFHEEEGTSLCSSPEAQMLTSFENAVHDANEDVLLVRTHAYGWAPENINGGWLESIIENLESSKPALYSSIQHATPILVADLADRIEKVWVEDLTGVIHIAGAERVSPQYFVEKLSICFGLSFPNTTEQDSLIQRPFGYGLGENSLNCSLFRQTIGSGMPVLHEGLTRLNDQKTNGYLKKLNSVKIAVSQERVA